jgi:hypothetical protein
MITAAILAVSISAAYAECDCSQHTGTCQATGTLDLAKQLLTFKTSTTACAQVTYSVNGDPSSVTVSGGAGSTDYLVTNPGHNASIAIDSCSICASAQSSTHTEKHIDQSLYNSLYNQCMAGCSDAMNRSVAACIYAEAARGGRDSAATTACFDGPGGQYADCIGGCPLQSSLHAMVP